ncbi:hypothetical protein LR48_Vigan10g213900 [Vigna angularis]|uniref:Bromo domain-containing protein n=1 Tax=Phaseolus angularis TaxID=3914 RepID=A0A0L9VMX1_PHAAN|nr:transcription factor GTE12 [Vigna angularis]KAG2384276.1 uncharacterized protein HKW66_Vig0149610 [Vigna angularis]KOM56247.1 hypothetical protein LR48_Vigan10g213900 [Vigna angularis]
MEETQQSRKKLIIKIYSSRPKNREGVCELKNKKGYYAEAIWIDVKSASKACESNENIRYDDRGKRKKKEMVQKEWKKRERNQKVENAMRMDSCKKMQCWTMMKRLMVGRHAWVLKKNEQNKKVMSLKDIELKLKRLEYSEVDDFAYDMRNVFSYPLGYPPKSEIHKIARQISHDFQLKWKTMKKKWILEKPNL